MEVLNDTTMFDAGFVPKSTIASGVKFCPLMVTVVPPAAGPVLGTTPVINKEAQLMAILKEFAAYYNRGRPHRSLGVERRTSWRLRPDLNALTRCGRTPA
jgi:hypothetical protein